MRQLFGKGRYSLLVQAKVRQDILSPNLLRFQLPVRGTPVGGVAVPAVRQLLLGGSQIIKHMDALLL